MQNMPSVMQHDFSKTPSVSVPRSKFDRSHGYTTTLNVDYLYPVLVDCIVPGDSIDLKTLAFGRINTPIFPLMDNIKLRYEAFFVPDRLVWDNFKKFQGEQTDPADSIDFLIPKVDVTASTGYLEESIYDYMGLPTKKVAMTKPNALMLRSYNMIWNAWYRDENLQDSVTELKGDSADPSTTYELLKRNKRADYFTMCLPWPQKGDAVLLPLGSSAPITGIGKKDTTYTVTNSVQYETDSSGTNIYAKGAQISTAGVQEIFHVEEDPNNSGKPNIRADLTEATAITVNELREAIAIQRLLEASARGGTRYTEVVKSIFGVTSPDARLQRPEFLGSATSDVHFQEIAQTSSTDATTPQGNLSAKGVINFKSGHIQKSFTEHGSIIVLVSVQADLRYQQGLAKKWTYQTRLDLYTPYTANLGEQAVLNQEIYIDAGTPGNDTAVFGYIPRWDEMRTFPSLITGAMRSNHSASLDPWHLAQEFSALPVLNSDFIEENVPINRIVALPNEPDFTFDMWHFYHHTRPMPTFSTPSLLPRL